MHIPGLIYRIEHRSQNLWWDFLADFHGYCNHCPWRADHEGGGYSFWRCALPHGHDGLHRARNYTWTDSGHTDYSPMDHIDLPRIDQPWDRKPILSFRQSRQNEAWIKEQGGLAWDKRKYLRHRRIKWIKRWWKDILNGFDSFSR